MMLLFDHHIYGLSWLWIALLGFTRAQPPEEGEALFPSIFNLASNSIIETNATCGLQGPERYCKLVEHVLMKQPQCGVCDNTDPHQRHPAEYAVDGTNRWWQSPALAEGRRNEWVTITLDLRQEYQVAYVIVKAGIAPRPGNWVLERSLNGVDYQPWQYYAISDEQCVSGYGIQPTRGHPRYKSDEDVICTSQYSKLDPLEHGEIHTSLVNSRPGVEGPSKALQDFTRARYVRLRLQRIRTLNADKMILQQRSRYIDPSVTRRYFYSIKDISIGGQCICYGHAEHCPADRITGQLRCECKHNTCGDNCQRCCPLFNQVEWMAGTNVLPHVCKPCQCFNHAVECRFDAAVDQARSSLNPNGVYEGGGVCVDCQHKTQGTNCDECIDLHYRPTGVSQYQSDACRPCDCNADGSVDGQCVKDETRATNGLAPGDCNCKRGFGGRQCDRCAAGFRNYPVCEPCPCNRQGSANFATCDEPCICKPNVEGEFCDKCKANHFNLDEHNPDGCTACFCFGMTDQCRESDWGRALLTDTVNWTLTDQAMREIVRPTSNTSLSMTKDDRRMHYWMAPDSYRGNMLTTYGGHLRYFIYFVPSQEGPFTPLPDVIIKGDQLSMEFWRREPLRQRENISIEIRMSEKMGGWYNSVTRQPATKEEFMSILASVKHFLIRALYHHYQVQASVTGLSLDVGFQSEPGGDKMTSVEMCSCPPEFTGLSCEGCQPGFRRVNNQFFGGKCEACECNGRATKCDPFSAECIDCTENTAGPRCDLCKDGFYMEATGDGKSGVCRPCACPLTGGDNNFSPTCLFDPDTKDYTCTSCKDGYMGNKCEVCADGYFGSPMTPGNFCEPCRCTENIDPAAVGNCDPATGQCLKCIGYTEGWQCDRCKPDHYGSAHSHTCAPCSCNVHGSLALQCDNSTGECSCKTSYLGRHCDRCENGHGGIEEGCPPCECSKVGATSDACDASSGQCLCRPGVFGKRCDQCAKAYYNFTDTGCTFCDCNTVGSSEESCDTGGHCSCKPHVDGPKCSKCEKGFFNLTSGKGCEACDCHPLGSDVSAPCDATYGRCRCKPGVTGRQCDKCQNGFYGLSEDGCQRCQVCPAPGQVCDPENGDCVCPSNTVGDVCERCAENTWNYHPYEGCKPCDCDPEGSMGSECHLVHGNCTCKESYTGQKCDQCHAGWHNFPVCERCRCDRRGSQSSTCRSLTVDDCACDDDGQCSCKTNVIGQQCDRCSTDSFGLDGTNPAGCTQCFCFNRTAEGFCIQSNYVWQQIPADKSAGDRRAVFEQPFIYWEQTHGLNVFSSVQPFINSYPTNHIPLYWSLPPMFLGDKTLSYNGNLSFTVANIDRYDRAMDPDPRLHEYPLAVLVGNHRIILEYPATPVPSGQYVVRFREDLWRRRQRPDVPVSRQTLMVALQKVDMIYVRGTFGVHVQEARLSNVALDVAVPDGSESDDETADAGVINSRTAIGIEQCPCQSGYAGTSCQDPADGFCRIKPANYLDSPDELDLIGTSKECLCHGHSSLCDKENCHCKDCQHNTMGDSCQFCADGFYGDASTGTEGDCKPCACPTVDRGFSETCRPVDGGQGFVCTACQPGYQGDFCERCARGYYGDPSAPQGSCRPCACNRDGSVTMECDPASGQCDCREGLRGRDCSLCKPRHALIGRDCVSCDQGCTLDLMKETDQLNSIFGTYNFTGLLPAPWGYLSSIENRTKAFRADMDANKNAKAWVQAESSFKQEAEEVLNRAKNVLELAGLGNDEYGKMLTALEKGNTAGEEGMRAMGDLLVQLSKMIDSLHNYENKDRDRPIDVDKLLAEAEELRNKIVDENNDYVKKRFNRARNEAGEANKTLTAVLNKKLNESQYELLDSKLKTLNVKVDDLRARLFDEANKNVSEAKGMGRTNAKVLEQLKENMKKVEELQFQIETNLKDAKEDMATTRHINYEAHHDGRKINSSLVEEIDRSMLECEKLTNQYRSLIPQYGEEFVKPAQLHADELERQAQKIDRDFQNTQGHSKLAVQASSAYEDIKEKLNNASGEALMAQKAADMAMSQGVEDIVDRSANSKKRSAELLEQATALTSNEIGQQLQVENARVAIAEQRAKEQLEKLDKLEKSYEQFDKAHKKVGKSMTETVKSKEECGQVLFKADGLMTDVEVIEQQAKKLTEKSTPEIESEVKEASEAKPKIEKAKADLKTLSEQANRNQRNISALGGMLRNLREKVDEFRQKASLIKLSVTDGTPVGGCVRSFRVPLVSTPVNRVQLMYRPKLQNVPNTVLFSIFGRKRPTPEYIVLELRDRQIMARYNLGSGEQRLTASGTIYGLGRYSAQSSKPQQWYNVEFERVGNRANLTVSRIIRDNNGEDKLEALIGSQLDENVEGRIFDVGPDGAVASVGLPAQDASYTDFPPDEDNTAMSGVIGTLRIDGHQVPLFDFVYENSAPADGPSEGAKCRGMSPMTEPPSTSVQNAFQFVNGYVVVPTTGQSYSASDYDVQFLFKTVSQNGLMYFRGEQSNKDFVSIELLDGHVVTQIYLGGESLLHLQSESIYNDNKFHRLHFKREKLSANLSIDAENIDVMNRGRLTGLDVKGSSHYFGGVPSSFDREPWLKRNVQWEGFVGCIRQVRIDGLSAITFSGQYQALNVGDQCSAIKEALVGFEGNGFMALPGITFGPDSSLSVNFLTHKETGVILHQSGGTQKRTRRQSTNDGFIAISIVDGNVNVIVGSSSAGKVMLSSATSDAAGLVGQLHNVMVTRDVDNRVTLYLDDVEVDSGELASGRTVGSASDVMLVGGFGTMVPMKEEISTKDGFHGCISGIYENYRLIELNPSAISGARIGNCPAYKPLRPESSVTERLFADSQYLAYPPPPGDLAPHFVPYIPATTPTLSSLPLISSDSVKVPDAESSIRLDTTTTANVSVIPVEPLRPPICDNTPPIAEYGAADFGLSKHSFAFVWLDRAGSRVSRLGFEDGPAKRKSFERSFRLSLEFRALHEDGVLFAWSSRGWRQFVVVILDMGRLVLRVQGHRGRPMVHTSTNTLELRRWYKIGITKDEGSIRVDGGGESVILEDVPKKITLKNRVYVGGMPLKDFDKFDWAKQSLNGCIRRMEIDGKRYELLNEEGAYLRPCYQELGPGTFFPGDGYASTGLDAARESLDVSMYFRTGKADGLLGALPDIEPKIVFELKNGRLSGRVAGVEVLSQEQSACNNQWHRAKFSVRSGAGGSLLSVQYDDLDTAVKRLPIAFVVYPGTFYLGSVPGPLGYELGSRPLVGCLKDVTLNGRPLRWQEVTMYNTFDACPK